MVGKVNLVENFAGRARPRDQDTKINAAPLCYVIFVAYIAYLYGVAQKALFELDQKIIPSGDAMTYVVFFYRIVN